MPDVVKRAPGEIELKRMVGLFYAHALPSLEITQNKFSGANSVTRARSSAFPHLVPVLLPNYQADQIGILERHRADYSDFGVVRSKLRYRKLRHVHPPRDERGRIVDLEQVTQALSYCAGIDNAGVFIPHVRPSAAHAGLRDGCERVRLSGGRYRAQRAAATTATAEIRLI
jgi:hypothetical protein